VARWSTRGQLGTVHSASKVVQRCRACRS
jgi:hypothetical protein